MLVSHADKMAYNVNPDKAALALKVLEQTYGNREPVMKNKKSAIRYVASASSFQRSRHSLT